MVGTLRYELDTVEERYLKVINENNMVGEDYRMRAHHNFEKLIKEKAYSRECELKINKLQTTLDDVGSIIPKQEAEIEYLSMQDTDKSQGLLREVTRTKRNKKALLEAKAMLKMKEQQTDDQ